MIISNARVTHVVIINVAKSYSIRSGVNAVGMGQTTYRQYTCKHDTETRSRNHNRRGKAVLHILSVCMLNYPAQKPHALYYIVICGLSGSTIFFHIIS
jgi:hypothetical protein